MSSDSLPPDQQESKTVADTELLNQLQLAELQNKQPEGRLVEDGVETLREREERFRLVLDSAKIGTWDFRPQSGNLFWDDRCKELFGMAPQDSTDYETFLKGIHPDDRDLAHQTNQNAINGIGGGEYNLEYRTIGFRDNKLRWIRAKGRSYKDESGVTVRYAGTVIDITEEKYHEQRMYEEQERFRLLATSIPQIVWTADKDGIVDYMSDKWQLYTGHVPTYQKFSFRELLHPDDANRVTTEWNGCLEKGLPYRGEYRLKNIVTNEYRWFSCTTAPLLDENNKVIKWIGSATDIQDQKNTERILEKKVAGRTAELETLNELLAKSNSELEQYANVTSHDLKEPVRKIQTYNSLLKTKFAAELPAEALDYLSKIDSATNKMSGLIEDLLKYSKLSTSFSSPEDVDLNLTIRNVCSEVDYLLKEKNITVDATVLPTIKAVPVQIQQLFFNLISNAIKFSKPVAPNVITISCSAASETDKIRLGFMTSKVDYHKLKITDQGIGFPKDENEKIFGMFHRLNSRSKYEGHGIGLALCRKIVNNHGGVIWADGKENQGASFTILLPADR